MNDVMIHWAEHALLLSALLMPIYFIVKWERGGFRAGVLSFWACFTLWLWMLMHAGEHVPEFPFVLVGGWYYGTIYCLPFYVIKCIVRSRRNPGRRMCSKCGGDLRNTPGWCQECGPVAMT